MTGSPSTQSKKTLGLGDARRLIGACDRVVLRSRNVLLGDSGRASAQHEPRGEQDQLRGI
jgi:hypothetical protein